MIGASMSVGVIVVIGLLLFYQFIEFFRFQSTSEIMVSMTEDDQFFMLNLDITFPETPCSILSLDIVDVTGVHVVNVGGKMSKNQLDKNGKIMQTYDAYTKQYSD